MCTFLANFLRQKQSLEEAGAKIKELGVTVINPVELPPASSLKLDDEVAMPIIMPKMQFLDLSMTLANQL